MSRGIGNNDPTIVSAFHSSLAGQVLVILLVALGLAVGIAVLGVVRARRAPGGQAPGLAVAAQLGEPRARFVLRVAFGMLWTLDGLLQLQPAMPLGLPSGVLGPAAAGAPGWVQRVADAGITTWSNHPITAATSAVWIQLAIGIALLAAPRGTWSRGAGAVSAVWGLAVWVVGESFGGLFTPGASWLFGLPGAALFYALAGALLALPDAAWSTPTLGRRVLRAMGVVFVACGIQQAWPGRGTWVGRGAHGTLGLIPSMSSQMATVPQPRATSTAVSWFARVSASHGFAVNLVVVVALLGIGLALLVGRRVAGPAVGLAVVVCLADWLLVQDLGFFGGVGTDPNSMLPIASVLVAGYLALRPATVHAGAAAARVAATARGYLARAAATVCVAALAVGVVPMAVASFDPHADAILTEAVNGTPQLTDFPEYGFSLVDQFGRRVSLASLRGSVVVLTFLDPVCTTDCPIIAQQLAAVDRGLPAGGPKVEFVVVDANPTFRSTAVLRAFDEEGHLQTLGNWLYLTGTVGALTAVWDDYDAGVLSEVGGAMVAHNELVYVISTTGRVRAIEPSDPGDNAATRSSLATLLAREIATVRAE